MSFYCALILYIQDAIMKKDTLRCLRIMKAVDGFEPTIKLLQSRALPLGYRAILLNDSDGNRTRVTAVKGRCLNRLTTGPYAATAIAVTVDYNIILLGRMQEVFLFFISAFCFFLFMAYLRMTLK